MRTFHHAGGWTAGAPRTCSPTFFAVYQALTDGWGKAPVLPERRPFRDYVAWLARQDKDRGGRPPERPAGRPGRADPLPFGCSVPQGHESQVLVLPWE